MMQERIFELAKKAGLTRVVTCCEGVENKLCANDQWKGNLGPFAAVIEREVVDRCAQGTTELVKQFAVAMARNTTVRVMNKSDPYLDAFAQEGKQQSAGCRKEAIDKELVILKKLVLINDLPHGLKLGMPLAELLDMPDDVLRSMAAKDKSRL